MLVLQDSHPARTVLNGSTKLITPADAERADIRPLRLGVLNLMPVMDETENDILKSISQSILQIEPVWIRVISREKTGKHTSLEHIEAFYQSMEEATKESNLDGLIVTGAPIEILPFEDVTYWNELCQIMEYAKKHVYTTLYLCWSAMAAVYYFYGIKKNAYPQKLAGVFPLRNVQDDANVFSRGMDEVVSICQSRHTDIDQVALQEKIDEGIIVPLFTSNERPEALQGQEVGVTIFATADKSALFNLGHFEYNQGTIAAEVDRDNQKATPVIYPVEHYFSNEHKREGLPPMTWKASRTLFYGNFLNAIYQRMNEKQVEHTPFLLR